MATTIKSRHDSVRKEKLWKALAEYGIYTEEQLNEAINKMKPLNIGIMVSPVPQKN